MLLSRIPTSLVSATTPKKLIIVFPPDDDHVIGWNTLCSDFFTSLTKLGYFHRRWSWRCVAGGKVWGAGFFVPLIVGYSPLFLVEVDAVVTCCTLRPFWTFSLDSARSCMWRPVGCLSLSSLLRRILATVVVASFARRCLYYLQTSHLASA